MRHQSGLSIGEVARRSGLSVSAIRFYEAEGLVFPWRDGGGRRRFSRGDLRRLGFILAAQQCGFTLPEIRTELDRLPGKRTPTKADWARISARFRAVLEARILAMTRLRDRLDSCIGCGCLSLRSCALYNPQDRAGARGPGPRYLIGDDPE